MMACSSPKNQLEQTGATGAIRGRFSLLRSTPYGGSGQLEHRSKALQSEPERDRSAELRAANRRISELQAEVDELRDLLAHYERGYR